MNLAQIIAAVLLGLATSTAVQAAPNRAASPPRASSVQLVHEGHAGAAQANGVVNAVDPGQHKITLSHGAIKSLGWPAMTMEFAVDRAVDLSAIKAGSKVSFTLVRGAGGAWVIDGLKPQ
jgi:Cu(I)/Ag(I) efflux system periplasmic protein CusF